MLRPVAAILALAAGSGTLFSAGAARADRVLFHTGKAIEGVVQEEFPTRIKFLYQGRSIVIPRDRIAWYTEQYLRNESDKADLRASPLRAPRLAGQPPAMIVTAGFDPLRDEGRAYAERLREAGVEVLYREYPGQIHAFVSLTKAIPQGMACTLAIAEYLQRRLA